MIAVSFQEVVHTPEGYEDVDVEAEVDLRTHDVILKSVRSTARGVEQKLRPSDRWELEVAAIDAAEESADWGETG